MNARIVLITGANTGIGYQIVRALCSSNNAYNIILGGRSPSKIQEAITAAQTEFANTKSKLSPVQVDVESDDSINTAFNEVKSKFGKVDILVNNAGMYQELRDKNENLKTKNNNRCVV
jgi:NADP-dependent 3-hydroxy acid dehydrogenase YdfG